MRVQIFLALCIVVSAAGCTTTPQLEIADFSTGGIGYELAGDPAENASRIERYLASENIRSRRAEETMETTDGLLVIITNFFRRESHPTHRMRERREATLITFDPLKANCAKVKIAPLVQSKSRFIERIWRSDEDDKEYNPPGFLAIKSFFENLSECADEGANRDD